MQKHGQSLAFVLDKINRPRCAYLFLWSWSLEFGDSRVQLLMLLGLIALSNVHLREILDELLGRIFHDQTVEERSIKGWLVEAVDVKKLCR